MTTQDQINNLKEKMARMHRTSNELSKARKQLDELEESLDSERLLEIEEELKTVARYGPEAAALKMEQEKIQERTKKRKEAAEEIKTNEQNKAKADKAKTIKARDASEYVENEKKNSTTRKSSNNVLVIFFRYFWSIDKVVRLVDDCQFTISIKCLCLIQALRPCHQRNTS